MQDSAMTPAEMLPDTNPDLYGSHGMAWMLDVAAVARRQAERNPGRAQPPVELTVCAWVIHAPTYHPIWHSYAIGCISLREMPPWPPAHVSLPGSTHEVFLMALDPEQRVTTDESPPGLMPLNFSAQFAEASDDTARARIAQTVSDIVQGLLSPDTDHLQRWIDRFSASNLRGTPVPDMLMVGDGQMVAVGTGANMVTALGEIALAASPAAPGVH